MFARWYALFLGFLLLVVGIAGLVAAGNVTADIAQGGLVTSSIIWLIIAVVGLWLGFAVRNNRTLRWYAGIVGGLLFLWGVIQMLSAPQIGSLGVLTAVASVGGFLVLLGAIGLAAALVPAYWMHETTPTAMPA